MSDSQDLFWELMEPHYRGAIRFCRKLTGDREQADDLFQDAALTALARLSDLRDRESFRPWFYQILVNRFRSRKRRWWWRRVVPLTAEIETGAAGEDPSERHAARRLLGRALAVLTAEEQALVTLHELEGWPVSELAALRKKTEGAIKAQLFRARRKMKDALMRFSEDSENSPKAAELPEEDEGCIVAKPGLD